MPPVSSDGRHDGKNENDPTSSSSSLLILSSLLGGHNSNDLVNNLNEFPTQAQLHRFLKSFDDDDDDDDGNANSIIDQNNNVVVCPDSIVMKKISLLSRWTGLFEDEATAVGGLVVDDDNGGDGIDNVVVDRKKKILQFKKMFLLSGGLIRMVRALSNSRSNHNSNINSNCSTTTSSNCNHCSTTTSSSSSSGSGSGNNRDDDDDDQKDVTTLSQGLNVVFPLLVICNRCCQFHSPCSSSSEPADHDRASGASAGKESSGGPSFEKDVIEEEKDDDPEWGYILQSALDNFIKMDGIQLLLHTADALVGDRPRTSDIKDEDTRWSANGQVWELLDTVMCSGSHYLTENHVLSFVTGYDLSPYLRTTHDGDANDKNPFLTYRLNIMMQKMLTISCLLWNTPQFLDVLSNTMRETKMVQLYVDFCRHNNVVNEWLEHRDAVSSLTILCLMCCQHGIVSINDVSRWMPLITSALSKYYDDDEEIHEDPTYPLFELIRVVINDSTKDELKEISKTEGLGIVKTLLIIEKSERSSDNVKATCQHLLFRLIDVLGI